MILITDKYHTYSESIMIGLLFIPIIMFGFQCYFHWKQSHQVCLNTREIDLITFIYTLIKHQSLNLSIDEICQSQKIKNFYVRFLWKRIFVLTDRQLISQALSHKNLAQTYIQKNFNLIHGHFKNINQYDSHDLMRQAHHISAKQGLLSGESLTQILMKYKYLLWEGSNETIKGQTRFSISQRLETFMSYVWAEFSYGPDVNHVKYQKCRQLILHRLGQDFHSSHWVKIPIFGAWYCQLQRWWHREDYRQIDHDLHQLMLGDVVAHPSPEDLHLYIDPQGFMGKYYSFLRSNDQFDHERLISTSFLLVLVVDFLHKVFLDYLLRSNLKVEGNQLTAEQTFEKSLYHGFLYPLRYRWQTQDYLNQNLRLDLNQGDLLIYDLKSSGLYFSSGPHSCIGQTLVKKTLFNFFHHEIVSHHQLKLSDHDGHLITQLNYDPQSYNVPKLIEEPMAQWVIRRKPASEAIENMRSYNNHLGVMKYLNVLNLYANPSLFQYIVEDLAQHVEHCQATAIVGVETRGLVLSGALAQKLKLPVYIIRKAGSLPGLVHRKSYQKYNSGLGNQQKESILEFSKDDDLTQHKVILVDDGISSAGTFLACIDLVRQAKGEVVKLVAIVDHSKSKRLPAYEPFEAKTYACFNLAY